MKSGQQGLRYLYIGLIVDALEKKHDKSKTYQKNYSRSIYHSKSKFIESNKIELVPKHIIELTFDP